MFWAGRRWRCRADFRVRGCRSVCNWSHRRSRKTRYCRRARLWKTPSGSQDGNQRSTRDDTLNENMQKTSDVAQLAAIAKRMRRTAIEMITEAGSGHPGGSLSAAEIVTTLFFDVLRHDPENPHWPDRDRFILSKGHCCPILYAVMAECGYCPKDKLMTLRKLGSIYQGHPDVRFLPALEASTGSLGQGLSLGIGMALAAKLNGSPSRTYVILGDGEIQEGQIWEAAMAGAFHKADNLVAIVDNNRIQLDGFVADIMAVHI